MRHFYLIINREKENAVRGAELISDYLIKKGCVCRKRNRRVPAVAEYRYTDSRTVPRNTECVIVLGGDGTLIQAARDLAGRNLPLFGVNMGHLGYLTQIGREEDICPALDLLIADDFRLETRMMLAGKLLSEGKVTTANIALNDITLSKVGFDLLKFNLYVNGVLFNDYSADGMIVSTPTGSTGYNLSAGGPIAAPEASLVILTPICPHTLNSRSIVLGPECHITLEVLGDPGIGQFISFDGDTVVPLKSGDRIEICRSEITTTLIQLKEVPFLDNIRNKMKHI